MVICPIAVAVGCRKCPAFAVCPLKTVIGDAAQDPPAEKPGKPEKPEKPGKSAAARPASSSRQKAGANRKGARARRPRK